MVAGLLKGNALAGEEAVRHGVFNTVSMMTTTGFASADFNEWPSLTLLVLFGAVMIGGSAGSTSGSIKLVRHSDLSKLVLTALMYLGRLEIVPVVVEFTASHWRG